MSTLKKLASQTAIYGLSSIVGRLFNYFLTPIYLAVYTKVEYGEYSEMYAYVSFFIVILTYGMETAFFRFSNQEKDKQNVYATAITSLGITSSLFILLGILFSGSIANFIGYASRPDFIIYFVLILGIDAFCSIPMANLRQTNQPIKFASINLISIGVTIVLTLLFISYAKVQYDSGNTDGFLVSSLYNPTIGIAYVFIINLVSTLTKLVLLHKEVLYTSMQMDLELLKKMLLYSSPLLVAGVAGIINETLDRILLRRILEAKYNVIYAKEQIAVYSGIYKLSILISLFIQAFRYAAEPFFFSKQKDKDANKTYALVMDYFVITLTTMFVGIMLYLNILKYFLTDHSYWDSLHILPILLLANICLGIYYNQSIWYKLSGKTKFGAYIAVIGAGITIALNLIFIPYFGFVASAWTTFITYFTMMIISYVLGKKHYPIRYNNKKIGFYVFLSLAVYFLSLALDYFIGDQSIVLFIVHSILFIGYVGFIYFLEKPTITKLLQTTK